MAYNYITDSNTNAVYKTTSPEGSKLIQQYVNQVGGERISAKRKRLAFLSPTTKLEWMRGATEAEWEVGMGGHGPWDLWVGPSAPGMASRRIKAIDGESLRPGGYWEARRAGWRNRLDYSFLTHDQIIAMDKNIQIAALLKRGPQKQRRGSAWIDIVGVDAADYIAMLQRYQDVLHNSDEYKSMLIAVDAHGEVLPNAAGREKIARDGNTARNRAMWNAVKTSEQAARASEQTARTSEQAAKIASEVVNVAALDKEFGPNMKVYNAVHDLTTSRTLARLDSLISAVRNSSLNDPFSKLVSPDF